MLNKTLLFFFITFQAVGACPDCSSLDIHVSGIKSDLGLVRIILSKDKENFEAKSPAEIVLARAYFRNTKANIKGIDFHFPELPSGEYAFKIFHDENKNELLDFSLLGKPIEGFAVSGYEKVNQKTAASGFHYEKAKFSILARKKTKKAVVLLY